MKQLRMTAAAVGFAVMLAAGGAASAADIKVISSNALKTTLEQLGPAFEKASGHKVVFTFGAAVPLTAEIKKGATFDLDLHQLSRRVAGEPLQQRDAADRGGTQRRQGHPEFRIHL